MSEHYFCFTVLDRHRTLAGLFALLSMLVAPAATSQIKPDETLGNEGSLVIEDVLVRESTADLIEGGATRGGNLFHSFSEFNVDEGQRVYFANPEGIESILSRITGNSPSNIFGLLGVDGSADLFFLNPNGIVFGETATFDIEGSFYGTTGDAVELGDGVFSAVQPASSRLLQVSPSILLENYLTADSGDIKSRGQLAVLGDLVLAGNGVDLQGQVAAGRGLTLIGLDKVKIRDTATVPFVGFAGGDLLVQGNQQVDIVALNHRNSGLFSYGDMVLRSQAPVDGDAYYWSGGGFRVETLEGDAGALESPVDPIIRALGDIVIDQYIGSSLHILAGGSVNIGTAIINAPDAGELDIDFLSETVTLSDGTTVEIDGGAQPTLDIRAGVEPEALGTPPIAPITGFDIATDIFIGNAFPTEEPSSADITIGDAFIAAPSGLVLLTNQYQQNALLEEGSISVTGGGIFGEGIDGRGFDQSGSDIFIDSRDSFILNGGTQVRNDSVRNAGDIKIISEQDISIGAGALIDSSSSDAASGNINLRAENILLEAESLISSNGDSGKISLAGDSLLMKPLSIISTSADGTARSGDIEITFSDSVKIDGGNIGTITPSTATGDSGDIFIETDQLDIDGFGFLTGNPLAPALTGGDITTTVNGKGNAGNILIDVDQLTLTGGAQVSASSLNQNDLEETGNSGDILIKAADFVEVDGFLEELNLISRITNAVGPGTTGNGGGLTIETGRLSVQNGAQVQAGSFGKGQGGSISIRADNSINVVDYIEDDRVSGIFAGPEGDVATGNSGDISIISDIISISGPEAFISNDVDGSASGSAGNVDINSRILTIRDGGRIVNGTEGEGRGGTLVINSNELVEVIGVGEGGVPSSLSTATFGFADGGDLTINTNDLSILGGAQVVSSSGGLRTGRGGDLNVNARGTIKISGVSADGRFISALSASSGFLEDVIFVGSVADGGDLSINAENLIISDSALVSSQALGEGLNPDFLGQAGNAGDLTINVSGRLDVINGSGLEANTSGPGNAGNLTIDAGSLSIRNNSEISTSTIGSRQSEFASGDGGNVDITVTGSTELSGEGGLGAQSLSGGNAAEIDLNTGTLIVRDGASITAASLLGDGNAGNIRINAKDSLIVTGGRFVEGNEANEVLGENVFPVDEEFFISSTINILSSAAPGRLLVETERLQVLDGASINANTTGSGRGGDISITARSVEVVGAADSTPSEIASQTLRSGDAGDITIESPILEIRDKGQILTSTLTSPATGSAEGDAGQITLRIPGLLRLQNGTIGANAESSDGGQLQLVAGTIILLDDSDIQTFVDSGENNGGDITIIADALVALDDSDITAFSSDGSGGNIDLSQTTVFSQNLNPTLEGLSRDELLALDGNGQVDINATGGISSGEISLNDASFIENSINELSDEIVDTATLTAGSCIANSAETTGSFVVIGGEGVPLQPETTPLATYPTGEIQSSNTSNTAAIQEAHGVYQLANGRLVLSHKCES